MNRFFLVSAMAMTLAFTACKGTNEKRGDEHLSEGRFRNAISSYLEAKKKKVGGGTTLYYFKEMGEHSVESYLKDLDKPILVMQGKKDVQVKEKIDYALYQELLADKPNVTFKLYEGLNHAFVPAICDSISKAKQEFNTERHIGENVIADIANWMYTL